MKRIAVAITLCALALALPEPQQLALAEQTTTLKVATLAPRGSAFMREFMRLDTRMREVTGGAVGMRLYASGVAGDEVAVLRKMGVNQLDAAMVSSEGLGQVLPEVNVLRAPGVVRTYKQLEAVQKALLPEFDASFEKKGFKLIAWGEAGAYRYFSRQVIRTPADVRKMRPWLWPSSPIMKETWRTIGAVPVPLGLPEVYGALQTKMVDLVETTSIAYMAMQWQTTDLSHVTEDTNGVLIGAWLMNKSAFDKLQPDWQQELLSLARADNEKNRIRSRKMDKQAFKALVKNGITATPLTDAGKKEMAAVADKVTRAFSDRLYSSALLARVQQIADATN